MLLLHKQTHVVGIEV